MGRILAMVLVLAAAGVAAIVALGPGKDRLEPPKAPAQSPTGSSGAGAGRRRPRPPAAPVGATVQMRALLFQTPSVHIRAGQAVRWVNADDVAHTVVQDPGAGGTPTPLFSSSPIAPGKSYRFAFHTTGTIAYVCTLHPTVMTASVVVDPA